MTLRILIHFLEIVKFPGSPQIAKAICIETKSMASNLSNPYSADFSATPEEELPCHCLRFSYQFPGQTRFGRRK